MSLPCPVSRPMSSLCVLTTLLVLIGPSFYCNTAAADTSVWLVSKGDRQICLGGTMHLLSPKQYPLPEAYNQCYAKADRIVLETDLSAEDEMKLATEMMQKMMLPEGKSLKDTISPATWRKIEAYAGKSGLALAMVERFKPQFVVLTITVLEMQKRGLTAEGVEKHFQGRAKKDKKPILQLETPDEQLKFLLEIGKGKEDELIDHTLKDFGKMDSLITPVLNAWRGGDLAAMEKLLILDMKKEFPALYRQIIVKRNKNWLPKIEKMIADAPREFVLVGALHLPGSDGLLELLVKQGYKIKQL